jgi:membrane protein
MARLREFPIVIRRVGPWTFLKRLWREIGEDRVFDISAAVAFYWLLAIFPFLLFVLTLTPLLPADLQVNVRASVNEWLVENLPPSGADIILKNIEAVFQPRGTLLSIGLITTLWAASAGMNATMSALDTVYDVSRPRHFLIKRLVSIGLTIAVVLMMIGVVVLIPIGSIVTTTLGAYMPDWASAGQRTAIDVGRYTIGVLLMLFVVSSIYQFGASVRRRWAIITPGAIFTVLTVAGLSILFRVYVERVGQASYDKMYGTLGGIMLTMLLFYLYAVVFLIGAQINSEIDFTMLGMRDGTPKPDEQSDPLPRLHGDDPKSHQQHHRETERFRFRIGRR